MRGLFALAKNYGMTIILFAVATKVIMLPLSIWVQKNSIKMVRLQPQVNEIAARNAADKDRAAQEQLALYKKEKYRPLLGVVPMLIQIPIIIGLINVVYNPLKHLLRLSGEVIETLTTAACAALGVDTLGAAGQLMIARMVQDPVYQMVFSAAAEKPGLSDALTRIAALDFRLFGLDMSQTPSLREGGWLLAVPVIAALSSLLLSEMQNRFNVLQKEQRRRGQVGMTLFLTFFSLGFAFLVPAAIGVYWAVGNLAAIAIMFFVNALYPPKNYIDYEALEKSKEVLKKAEKNKKTKQEIKAENKRSKADYKRFFASENAEKELVFYSSARGTYKYYRSVIEYILANSDIVIHYVASDPRDEVFAFDMPKLVTYYIAGDSLVYFFMKLDAHIVVMTMPEIEKYQYKRSLVRKNIEYIYMFHGVASANLLLKKGALDHYDTIFCVGPSQYEELQLEEAVRGIKPRKLVQSGYSLIDETIMSYNHMEKRDNADALQIMIAPSWHDDNILETCIDELLEVLLGHGYKIILRPHPEFVRRYAYKMQAITDKYADYTANGELIFDIDYTQNKTVFSSDVLITDWSTVCYEFSFATKRPTLFINTPMKVMNPDYKELGNIPLDIRVRDDMGESVNVGDIGSVPDIINKFIQNKNVYRERIAFVMDYALYNVGRSASVEAEYIIEQVIGYRAGKEY